MSRRHRQTDEVDDNSNKEIEKKPESMKADPQKDHMEQMKGQPATSRHLTGNPNTDSATVHAGAESIGGGLGAPGDQDEVKARMARDAELASAPRFDDDGNPIDPHGRPRPLAPGEAGQDDVERSLYTVGKGGVTVRGRLFLEGESVLLSEDEANQVVDMGNAVTHVDPVEAKAVSERRAERNDRRREKHAERHQAAAEEAQAVSQGE